MNSAPLNFEMTNDGRTALGNSKQKGGTACGYCWPALITAYHRDAKGRPCCQSCAAKLWKPKPVELKMAA